MTSDLNTKAAEIRAGLEGVTPGEWACGADLTGVITRYQDGTPNQTKNGWAKTICKVTHAAWANVSEHVANLKHIARLDPATVLAFLDERDQHLALIEQQAAELAAKDEEIKETAQEAQDAVLSMIFMPGVRAALDTLPEDDPIEPYLKRIRDLEAAEAERDELLREKERLGKLSDRYGVALMMIRAGCSQPQRFAGNILDDKEPVEIDLEDCDEDHR